MNRSRWVVAVVAGAVVATLGGCAGADVAASPTPEVVLVDPAVPLDDQWRPAIRDHDLDRVTALIAAGADVNAEIEAIGPPLLLAAQADDVAIVNALVAAGADVDARSPEGRTPLMGAAQTGGGDVVAALLAAGADVDAQDGTGTRRCAIHLAAQYGNLAAIEALVEGGVPVDQFEGTDGTALIYAAYYGELDAAVLLISLGADPSIADRDHMTAEDWAINRSHPEVADYLASLG